MPRRPAWLKTVVPPAPPLQVITFRDYLFHIVGPDFIARQLSTYPGYDEAVDPSVSNVFATAAYRFAHLMVQPTISRLDENYGEHREHPTVMLHKAFFAPWRIVYEGTALGPAPSSGRKRTDSA